MSRLADYFVVVGYDFEKENKGYDFDKESEYNAMARFILGLDCVVVITCYVFIMGEGIKLKGGEKN